MEHLKHDTKSDELYKNSGGNIKKRFMVEPIEDIHIYTLVIRHMLYGAIRAAHSNGLCRSQNFACGNDAMTTLIKIFLVVRNSSVLRNLWQCMKTENESSRFTTV